MAGEKQRQEGKRQELRVLTALRRKPMTIKQIAKDLDMACSSVQIYINRLKEAPRLIYVCDYDRKVAGTPAKIWTAGTRPDAVFVPKDVSSPRITIADRMARVLELLAEQPMTARELSERMHLVPKAIQGYIKRLHEKPNRRIYITTWRHPRIVNPDSVAGGPYSPVYAIGGRADAARPKKETSAERHARLHKSIAYRKERSEKRRIKSMAQNAVKQHIKAGPCSWMTALMNIPKTEGETA